MFVSLFVVQTVSLRSQADSLCYSSKILPDDVVHTVSLRSQAASLCYSSRILPDDVVQTVSLRSRADSLRYSSRILPHFSAAARRTAGLDPATGGNSLIHS